MSVALDGWAQWHPAVSLGAKAEEVVVGAEISGRASDGGTSEREVTPRIVEVEVPRRLVWEGGSLDAILGRRSLVLNPQPAGITEFTESAEFRGATPPTSSWRL
ncbi:hypothetical protein OG226_47470 [Streptomyces sp. NBC_01261]